jgi:hypothetical protein
MIVDSGNVGPDVYAPTVEFTLAANTGRDLQAAADADYDCVLGRKSAPVAFCFKTLRGPSNDIGSGGMARISPVGIGSENINCANATNSLRHGTIGYRKIRSSCARIFSAGKHGRL